MNALLLGFLLQTGTVDAATAGRAAASSTLVDDEGVRHLPRLAMDGLMATGWGEGDDEDGTWLEIDLGKNHDVKEVSIWPGNLSEGKKSFKA